MSPEVFFAPELPHGIFHLCIPQCVNQRVEKGCTNCIKHRYHLVHGEGGCRTCVYKYARHKKQDNYNDVRDTGKQGFFPPFSTVVSQGIKDDYI